MSQRTATLHRMVLADHECPYGRRAKELLERAGFRIDEHILSSREQVDEFKAQHGLLTTPLVMIDGETIGGCQELEAYLLDAGIEA